MAHSMQSANVNIAQYHTK